MSRTLLQKEQITLGARPANKASAISAAGQLMVTAGLIDPAYVDSLAKRENVSNTFLGHGVAIPHGMIEDRHLIRQTGIAILQIPDGLEWNDGQTVHLVVAIAAQSDEHINVLRRLTRLMQDEARLQQLFTCTDPALLIASLSDDAPVATSTIAAQDLEQRVEWTVDYPNGLHARPAGVWAATARQFDATIQIRHDNEVADAKKLTKLLQLGLRNGDRLVISANGPQSAAALSALREIMIQLTAQELANAAAAQNNARQAEQPDEASASAAPGIPDIAAPLIEGGKQLEAVLANTKQTLATLATEAARRRVKTEAGMLNAQIELLADIDLVSLCCRYMTEGHGVAWSWHQAIEQTANRFNPQDNPQLAAHVTNLRDAGQRVLSALLPQVAHQKQTAFQN